MRKNIDIINKKYNFLIVKKYVGKGKYGQSLFECLCDCQNKSIVDYSSLINGKTKSCGCYKKRIMSERSKKHNMYGTKIYWIWSSMIQRCINQNNKKYKNYGKRGIKVFNEWRHFNNYYNDFGKYHKPGLQMDRIDNNGNYCKENCRWTTPLVQANNRTDNRVITYCGKTKNLTQWGRVFNLSHSKIRYRLNNGYSLDKVFNKQDLRKITKPNA